MTLVNRGAVQALNFVWSVALLDWVVETQPGGGGGGGTVDQGVGGLSPWSVYFLTPQPVTGPLTDTQLRAAPVPISAASLPLPTGAATESTLALVKAKTDNLDVALSTRTKPADQQHAIVDSSALPAGASTEATLLLIKAKTDNIDVALSTRTKPADQQHVIVDSTTTAALTPAAPTFATVGVADGVALAASAGRKRVELVNTSSNFMSIGWGNAAVLYSGWTLTPYGSFIMDNPSVAALALHAIASGAGSNLGIQAYS